MSLLNDMLRDLSHQQSTVETAPAANQAALDFNAQEQRELFHNTSVAKPLPRTLVPSVLVFVSVLAILGLWKLGFLAPSNNGVATTSPILDRESSQTPVTSSSIIESTTAGQVAESTQHALSESKPTVEPVANNVVVPELGERIAALESAITTLSVVVANANIQANNKIVNAELTESEEIASAVPALDKELISEMEQGLGEIAANTSASVSIREPFAQTSIEPVIESQARSVAEVGEPKLSIAPNVKWQDQQQAQQANELVAQGQTNVAIEKLRNFIIAADQPRESVKALMDIFAMQENISAMQALVAQAKYLSVIEKTFYAAKIATIQQQDEQAIHLLETHLGEAERDENYRALLAGLYQRTGMHVEAANHYRRLLSVFGDKPAYWLGFALAQDALNQPQVAVQAYRQVNQYADLQPQVRTYVQQRIVALQR